MLTSTLLHRTVSVKLLAQNERGTEYHSTTGATGLKIHHQQRDAWNAILEVPSAGDQLCLIYSDTSSRCNTSR